MADITFKVPDNLPPPNIHISPAGHRVVHVAPINSESDDSSDALGQQFAKIAPLDMPQHQHNNKNQGGVQFPVNETDVAVVNPAFDPIKNPVQLTDRVIRKVYGENNSLDVSESAESLKNLPEGIKRRIIAKRMKKAKKLEKKKLKEERKRERKMEKIQLKNKMAIMKANIKKTKMDEKQRKKEIKEAARKGMSGHNDDDHGSSSSDYYDSTDDDETTRRDKALARRRRELQKQKAELENLKKLHEIEKISLKKNMKFQKRGGLPAAILGPNFENGDKDIHEQIQSSKKAMDDLKLRIKSKEKEVKIIERHHENNIEYELNLLKQNVKANIKKNKESMKYEKERAKGQEKNDKQILKEKEILAKEGAEWQNKRQHVSNDDRTPEEIQRDKELEQRSFDEALKEREAEIRMEREAKMRMEEDARRSAAIADRELQKQENIFAPDAAEQERLKILQQLQDKRMAEGGYPPKEGITKLSHQILKQSEHQKMINYMKDLEKVKDEEHKERMQEMRKSIEERNKAAANEGKMGKKDEKKLTAQTAAEIKAQEKQEAKAKKERLKQLKKNEKEEANELKRKKKQLAELEKERKKLHDKMQKHESDEQKLMDQMNREGLKANIKRLELEKNSQNNAKCEIEQQINICMGDQIRKAAMVMRQMKANGEFEGEVLDPSTGQKEIQEMNENIERLNREFESTKQEIRDLEEFEKKTELNEIEFLKKQGIIDATRLERKHDEEIETLIQLKRNDDVMLMKHQEELDKLTCEQKQIQNAQRNATDFAERAKIAEEAKLLQNMAAIIIKRKDDKEKEIDEKNAEIIIKQNEKGKLAKKEFDRLKKLGKIKEKEINRKLNERRKELNKRKAQLEKDAKDQREKTRHLEKSVRKDKLEVVEKLKKEGKLKEDEEDKKKKNKINELQKLLAKQAEKEATLNKQLNDLMNEENKIAQREIDQRIGKQLLIAKIKQIEDEKKVHEAQIAEHELRKREIQELEMDGEDIEEVFAKAVQHCDRKSQNSLDFEYNKTETNFGREKVSLMEIEKTKTNGSGKVEKTKTLSTGLAKNETSHQNKTMQRTKELEKINKIINDDGVDSDSDSDSDNDIREKLHLKDLRAVPSVKRVSSDSSLDTEKINAIVKAKKELEEDDTDVDTDDEMTDDEMKCDVNKPNKENLKLQKKMKKIKEKHKKKLRKEREKKLKEAEKLKKKQLKQQEKVMKEQLKKEKKELEMEVKEIEKEAKTKAKDEKKKQKEMLKNKNPALKSENNLPSDSESELDSDIEIMDIGGESENLTEKFKSQIEKNNKLKSKLLEKTKKKEDVQSQSHMENAISKEYGKNKLSKSIENKLNQAKENEDFESAQQPDKVTSDKITKLILERNENLKLRLQEKQKLLEAFGDSESETESEPEDEGPNKNTIKAEAKKKKKEAKQQGKLLKEQLKKEMKELEKEVKETEKQAKNKAKDAKKKQKEKLKKEKMKLKSGKEVFSDWEDEFDIENKFKDQMQKNRNLKSKLQEKQSLLEGFEILESEAESELDDVINSDEEFDMNIETEVKFKSKEEDKKFKDSMEKINKLRSKLQEKQTLLAGLDEPEIDSESEDEGPDKNTIKAEEKRKKKEAKQQEKLQKEQLKKEMKELEKEVKEMEKQAKNKVKDAKKKQKEKLKIEKMKSKLGKESPAGSDIGSPGQMQRQQQGSREGLVGNEMDIDEVIDSDNEIDLGNVSHVDFNCKEENKKFRNSMDKINKLKSKLQEKQNRLNVLDQPEIDSESEDEGPDKNTTKAEKKKKKKETKQQEKLIKEQLKNEMKELEKGVKEMEKQAKNKVKNAKKKQKEKLKSKSGKVQSDSEDEIDVESKFKDEIKKNNKLKSKLREKQSVIDEVDKSGDESDSNDATANKKGGKFKFWEKLRKSKNKKESLKSKSGNEALLSKKEKLGKQNDPASDSEYESERENQVLPIIDEDIWKKIVSLRTESQKDAAISLKEAFESKHLNDLEKHKHKLEESMKKKSKKDEEKYLKKVTKDIKSDQKKKLEKERKEQKKEQADMATFMKMLFRINNRESGNMGNSSGINDAIFQGTDARNLTSAETQTEHTNKQKISENLEKKLTTSKVVQVTNQNEQDIDLHKNRTEMLNRQIKELKMHITELKPLKLINVNLLEKLYKLDEQVKIKGELTHEKFDTQSRKIKKLCKRVYCLQSEKLGLTKDLHFLQEDFHILSSDMEQLKCDSDARHLKNKNLKTRLKNYHKENTRLQTELDTRNASYKEEIERILSDCRCVISTNENDQTLMHHLKTKIIDLETTVASYRKNQREHESLAQRKQQVEFLTTDLQLRANHMIKECQTQSDEQNKIMADTKKKCQAMQANRHKDVLMETNLKCTELALVTEKVFELTEKINDKNKTISEKDKIIKTLKSSLVEKRSCNFCMRSNEKRATKVLVNDNPKRKGLKIFKRQDNGLKDFQIRELEKQIELMQTNAKSMEELKDKTEQEKLAVLENNEALKRENERLKEKSKQTIHKLTLKFQSMKRAVNATLFNQVDMELCDEDDEMAAHLHGLMNDFLMSFRRIGGNTMTPFRTNSSHGGNTMMPASHENIKAQSQQQTQVKTLCSKCDVIKHEVSIQTETFTDQNHGTETTTDQNVSTEKKQNLMYSVTTQTDIELEMKSNCGENKDQKIKEIKNQSPNECLLAFDELTGKEVYDAYSQTDFPAEKMNCEKCECDKNESEAQTDLMGLQTNIGVINETTTPQIKYIKSCIKRPISPTNVAFKEPLSERSIISETDSGLNTMNTLSRIEDSSSESDLSDSEMPSKRNSYKSENIKMESKKSTNENKNAKGKKENFMDIIKNEKESEKTSDFEEKKYQSRDVSDSVIQENIHENATICKPIKESMTSTPPQQQKSNDTITTKKKSSDLLASLFGTKTEKLTKPKIIDDDEIFNIKPYTPSINNNRRRASSLTNDGDIKDDENKQRKNEIDIEIGEEPKMRAHTPKTGRRSGSGTSDLDEINKLKNYKDPSKKREYYPGIEYERELNAEEQKMVQQLLKEPLPDPFAELDYFKKKR